MYVLSQSHVEDRVFLVLETYVSEGGGTYLCLMVIMVETRSELVKMSCLWF